MALGEERVENEAVVSTIRGRYGSDQVLFTSNNQDANLRASDEGFQLVNPKSISETERKRFRADAGVQTSYEHFREELSIDIEKASMVWDPRPGDETSFAEWVKELGRRCRLKVKVMMMERPPTYRGNKLADCTADSSRPTIRFNKDELGEEFFKAPYYRKEQLEIVIHEFGHAVAKKGMDHGPKWGQGVARAGSRIAESLNQA